jgi:hypothetical protein
MQTPVHVVLTAAAVAAVVALLVGWLARVTARDIAKLTAKQKRQDARIKVLGEYVELLIACASATQSLMWYGDKGLLDKHVVDTNQWLKARNLFQPAQDALAKVQYHGVALVDESLRPLHDQFVADIERVVSAGSEGQTSREAWEEIVSEKPTSLGRAITAANDLYKEALAEYPVAVPNSILRRNLAI